MLDFEDPRPSRHREDSKSRGRYYSRSRITNTNLPREKQGDMLMLVESATFILC